MTEHLGVMGPERISDKLERVVANLQTLETKVKESVDRIEKYENTLHEVFKQNKYFSNKFIQGTSQPHEWFELKNSQKNKCHETGGPWPHLYHTFDPQLNNISDMILYIIQNCCCKQDQKKFSDQKQQLEELLDNLRHKKEVPSKELDEKICIKLTFICIKLTDIIKLLETEKCISLLDMKQLLFGGEDIPKNPKNKQIIPLGTPSDLKIKPPYRFPQ